MVRGFIMGPAGVGAGTGGDRDLFWRCEAAPDSCVTSTFIGDRRARQFVTNNSTDVQAALC
jgi:hypothetical protein